MGVRLARNTPSEIGRILRFGAVGLLNTALGYGVILAGLALGWGDFLANLAGYAVGLAWGFLFNARWTFAGSGAYRSGVARRYLLAFLCAYAANLAVVMLARRAGLTEDPLAHLAAIGLYSCLFYLASSRFVFVAAPRPGPA